MVQIDDGGFLASQMIEVANTARVPDAPIIRIHASGPGGTIYVRSQD